MAFIRLTSTDKIPVYINTNLVLHFFGSDNGTYIVQQGSHFLDDDGDETQLFVRESPETILRKIKEAEKAL